VEVDVNVFVCTTSVSVETVVDNVLGTEVVVDVVVLTVVVVKVDTDVESVSVVAVVVVVVDVV
jgi:hypothetical protein